MATRCLIGKEDGDHVIWIYCHYDGYPMGVGATLDRYYNSDEKVTNLLNKGDLSSLGKTLDDCTFLNKFGDPKDGTKRHYHIQFYNATARETGAEFLYVWDGMKWNCINTKGLILM